MAEPQEVVELTEDLTIQNVILESLLGAEFAGAEEERREATRQIERLNERLRSLRRSIQMHREDAAAAPAAASAAAANGGQSTSSSPSVRESTWASASTPVRNRHRDPAAGPSAAGVMSSPQGFNDIWSNPSSANLPSRKREFSSTRFSQGDAEPKSRRTTPTPGANALARPPRPTQSSFQIADIIDLTGDDVEEDGHWIAEQIKQENRQKQEHRDRLVAMQLAGQRDAEAGPSSSQNSNPAHTSAFAKLMATQQSNARFASDPAVEYQSPSPFRSLGERTLPSPVPVPSQQMPGSFSNNWDAPSFRSQSTMYRPPTVNHPHLAQNNAAMPYPGSVPSTPHQFPQYGNSRHVPHSAGTAYRGFSTPAIPGQQMPGAFPTLQHQQVADWMEIGRAHNGIHRPMLVPRTPSGQGSAMSRLVNSTSHFGMPMGVHDFDGPMDDRLANYLQEAYHDPQVSEKELDELLQNIRPDMDIPERNRDGTPAGLKSPLYKHQELALTWMKKMEEGTNKGGILADDMGLGKTISTLALMLSRPSTSRPKTNLIIGPLSLVRQWEDEILKKTKLSHRMSVFLYHNKKATTDEMLKFDVVLTTYGTIASELKRLEKFEEENRGRNIDYKDKAIATKFPLLHPTKATFYRIILDEAQCIKNKETRTAKACYKLQASYRWCLTGTPMMNGIVELYSLVHFLRIKPYSGWEQFRKGFGTLFGKRGDPKHVAMSRFRALLKAIMLRRKKDSQLDGKPILKLPKKTEEILYADLSPDELDFYKQLEMKSQVQFSKYLREGSVGKNYSSILVLLLRLRQACCHPHLNLDVEDAAHMSKEEMEELVKNLDGAIVKRIKEVEAFECPICYDAVPSPLFFIPCGHDSCSQCLARLGEDAAQANLQQGTESDRAKCPSCRGLFDPKKCFTYEAFKAIHMPESLPKPEPGAADEAADDDDDDESEDEYDDDSDVDTKGNLRGFIVDDEQASGDEKSDGTGKKQKKKKNKGKGKKKKVEVRPSMLKTLRLEAYKNREAYKRYMHYLRKTWMPAAKVTKCMELLKEIDETGEKTIIFSQWTLLLDLLEVAMHHDGFSCKPRRYDGSMSADQRNDSAVAFRERRDVKVMLVSLRAGNAGLNLTSASRVIIMDPFWNPYTEMQAVDRAYRIGQQKEVKVYRILTQNTVEDRIIALQEKKKEIVESALDEKESMKIGRLNVSELKFLFNTNN